MQIIASIYPLKSVSDIFFVASRWLCFKIKRKPKAESINISNESGPGKRHSKSDPTDDCDLLKPVWMKRTKVSPTSLFINVHSGELSFNRSRQQKARVGEILMMRICAILSFVVRLLSAQFCLKTLEESQMWFELLRFSVFPENFQWKISFLKEFRLSFVFHVPV